MPRRRLAGFTVSIATATLLLGLATARVVSTAAETSPAPATWADDLSPIAAADWNYDRAAHLIERAGFGGTPEEIARLAAMTPRQAVDCAGRLRVDRQQRPEAVRRIGHLGSRHGSVSAEPRRSRAPRARTRRRRSA